MHASSPTVDGAAGAPAPRGREAALARAQALSGLTFALFLVLHLVNALTAPLGPAAHDGLQRALRAVYQSPLVELSAILGALVVHVGSGILRARGRRGRAPLRSPATRWQRRLGWLLTFVVIGHAVATRGPSLIYDVWPEFAGVAFSLGWMPGWFYPYYMVFGVAAAYHMTLGAYRSLRLLGWRPPTLGPRPARLLLASFAGLLLLALLAYGGQLFAIADPMDNDYARLYLE